MRPHVLAAVFRRNVASYFSGVLGYLLIIAFVVGVAFLLFDPAFFAANLASLDSLSSRFPVLLLFIVPAITMTVWADERKLGTDELLFTMPATTIEVLLGKYLAVLAVYTILLLFTIPHLLILAWLGDPDWGLILTTYLGYWLSGAALLALGLLASAMTNSSTVAFVLGVLLCAIPVYLGELPFVGEWLEDVSLPEKLSDFAIGTIPIASILYFGTIAAFALYLNHVAITRRFWSARTQNGGMGWQMGVRGIAVLVALWSVTSILSTASGRIDLTQERLFTLSDSTRQLLDSIPNDRPVRIQAYLSPSDDVPAEYAPVRRKLDGLLRQIDSDGGRKLSVRVVEVEPFTDEADEAEIAGIEPREMLSEGPGGRRQPVSVYMGLTVESGFDEVKIPFFDRGTGVEYQLARAIGTVSREERLTVGVLETDAAVMGDPGAGSMFGAPPSQPWEIVTELGKQYEVKSVDAAALDRILDPEQSGPEIDVLLAVLPSSLTSPQMDSLVAYVKAGKPTLIFDDPMPVSAAGLQLAPRQEKPSQGNMFNQAPPPEPKADGGRATRLINALGIAWDYEQVVFDTINPHPRISRLIPPEYVFISPKSGLKSAINPKSEVTKGLQELLVFYPGMIQPLEDQKKAFTPLLRSGKTGSGLLRWSDLIVEDRNPMMGGGRATIRDERELKRANVRIEDNDAHTIAALIERPEEKAVDGLPPLNVVYVADVDMIGDFLFQVQIRKVEDLSLDNTTFLMNAIDYLAGEDRYIEIRSRRPVFRTLSRIDAQKQAIEATRNEQDEALNEAREAELESFRANEQALIDEINDDDSLTGIEKQQKYNLAAQQLARRTNRRITESNKEYERAEKRLEKNAQRQEQAIERKTRLLATMLAPIPAILLGLFVLTTRLSDERRGVERDRLVTT